MYKCGGTKAWRSRKIAIAMTLECHRGFLAKRWKDLWRLLKRNKGKVVLYLSNRNLSMGLQKV